MHYCNKWETKDGTIMYISTMHETHINNCIAMLKRQKQALQETIAEGNCDEYERKLIAIQFKSEYIRTFEKELDKRNGICYNKDSKKTEHNLKGDDYMKATGIVRRIDDLGRIVIPKEIRRQLCIREGDPLEIFVTRNGVEFRKDIQGERIDEARRILSAAVKDTVYLREGNTTIVFNKSQDKKGRMNIRTGVAMCNPTDKFNEEIGRAIAYKRMMGEKPSETLLG